MKKRNNNGGYVSLDRLFVIGLIGVEGFCLMEGGLFVFGYALKVLY